MLRDETIDEIREVRHQISQRFGHDTKALLDHYKSLEAEYSDRIVSKRSQEDLDPREEIVEAK